MTDWLARTGVTLVLRYEGDAAANTSGGERRGSAYAGDLRVQLTLDGDRLAGMPGISAFVDAMWISGGQPSKLVGDAQGVSSIAAPSAVRLYEAWVQYNTPENGVSVLGGRYDLNSEFYRVVSADLFLNNSFGIGPEFGLSGFAGPSIYPNTSFGVRLAYKPAADAVLRTAILDGAPLDRLDGSPNPFNPHAGVLLVGEAAWLTRPDVSDTPADRRFLIGRHGGRYAYDDKIAVGGWYYTASFDAPGVPATSMRRYGEGGAYLLVDRLLFQSELDPQRRLTGFLQFGIANPFVDRFATYIGAGLVMSGLRPDRPHDEVGLAVAMARNGSSYIEAQQQAGLPVNAAETALELSYLAHLAPWIALQPDLQYVIHPNTVPRRHAATVAQLRFELKY